jgi:two-component system phosphate regulon sensor histidine kinase PhoR
MEADLVALVIAGVAIVLLLAMLWKQRQRLEDREIDLAGVQRDLDLATGQLSALRRDTTILADTSFDALLMIDADRRVAMINEAACELFGPRAEAIGRTLMTLTRQHELDTLVSMALRGEPALESQIEIKERAFRVRIAVIESPEGSKNVMLALQDISELLRLARARRDMVANFSHDLRTPISSIRLLIDTLTHNFGDSSKRDKRLVRKIAGEIDSLEHMTQELIDLSIIESGRANIRMIPVDFADILREALTVMGTQIEQKSLQVVNNVPDDLHLLADPDQTRRVLMNVIHNAVKFTPSKGQIQFTAARDAQMATIAIQDTGPGIPPQDRTRIFERFYQVDTARSGQAGSGLGLSIAKHIIEAQGGKIWAEAGIPGGGRIVFTLPLAEDTGTPT